MSTIRNICGLLLVALLVAGCSSSKHIAAAQLGVERFRELIAARQFDQVYSEASEELKQTTTAQAMAAMLAAVDRKLGRSKARSQMAGRSNTARQA